MKTKNFIGTKRSRKKTAMGVIVLMLSAVLLLGSLFAYFSDMLEGDATVTAGTLDLVDKTTTGKGFIVERYKADETAADFNDQKNWTAYNADASDDSSIINPGDILRVKIAAANEGSKSAWLNSDLTVSLEANTDPNVLNEMKNNVGIYGSTYDPNGSNTTLGEFDASGIFNDSNIAILDGENESEAVWSKDATTITPIKYNENFEDYYYIVFNEDAGNYAQGGIININYTLKALQFRNNSKDIPANGVWADVDEIWGN